MNKKNVLPPNKKSELEITKNQRERNNRYYEKRGTPKILKFKY